MTLHLIGIGYKKEHISFEQMELIKNSKEVYLEYYTSFYQDEFSGRIATKVMQTSLALHGAIMLIVLMLFNVVISIIGVAVLLADSDHRMIAPFGIWLALYVAILYYFIPRLKR